MADDLRMAAALGVLVLARPVADGVDLSGRVLRYDPALPQRQRARLVRAALGRAGLLPMRQGDAGGLDGVVASQPLFERQQGQVVERGRRNPPSKR